MSGIEPWLLAMGGVILSVSMIGTLLALSILGTAVIDHARDRRGRRLPRAYITPRPPLAR